MDRKISELYQHLGLSTEEICGHSLTPQQQAVVDQLNTDNGEYLLKLGWIFAEGQDQHRQVLQNLLDEFSKEASADDLIPPTAVTDLTDPEALARPGVLEGHDLSHPTLCSLGFHALPWRRQVHGSAGGGAIVEDETVQGYLAFRDEWLHKKLISPAKASVIEVLGDSMEPTLEDGSSILVDHQRNELQHDRVFAVHTEDGLLVKRLAHDNHHWQLLSDNAHYKPLPWPEEATVIGQVMWTGRTL